MRINKAIYIQIISLILLIICTNLFLPDSSANLWQGLKNCTIYNENWTIETTAQSKSYDILPVFFYTDNNEQDIHIHKTLEGVSNGDCLGFFSFQQQIQVFVDHTLIYEFVPTDYSNSRTPGNKWNFIPLNETDSGKIISIHIYQCYSTDRISIPTMYYGSQAGIILNYLAKETPKLYVSLTMILFGILIGILCVSYRRKTEIGKGIHWLALFAIFRGIWGTIEGNTYSFFVSRLLLISQISYLSLKLAVTTFLQFFNYTFHDGKNKMFRLLLILSLIDFWGSSILQFLGIVDFAYTVFLTHAILLFGGIYACADVFICIYIQKNDSTLQLSNNRKHTYFAQLFGTIIIILTALIDMIRYYTTNSPDVAQYSRIGDITYVVTMTVALLLDFVFLIRIGHRAAIIREEAALDSMTKLRNRARFEKDMKTGNKLCSNDRGIIILDLNNLKEFNDQFGHNAGDQYIITASQLIQDIFSSCGTVYRIGGDEFCVITKNLSEQQFHKLQLDLENQMSALHPNNTSLSMQISSGFAQYDSSTDSTLHDTMKRADEQMYKRKLELKGEAGRSMSLS